MKKTITGLFLLLCVTSVFSQELPLIPKPASVVTQPGTLTLNSNTEIVYNNQVALQNVVFLNQYLSDNYDLTLKTKKSKKNKNGIEFRLDKNFKGEAYALTINDRTVTIQGDTAGLFYGLQTLLQLMPLDESTTVTLPQVTIKDEPRFKYRGAMLDAGRYFFTVEQTKRFLDLMSYYKLNTFHWHLTEDGGWRIEIKKYPLLTEIGAWRRGTNISRGSDTKNTEKFDRLPHGGFYSQKEIKEIVKYAAARNITIIPEIDMPGHSLSALAAYPEYSCTGGPFNVLELWGIQSDIFCAGNEKTYTFIQDILDELISLFPSQVIHIGGDEAHKDRWNVCPKCKAKMVAENLKDVNELQSYFIRRVSTYLGSKGRRILGWDEIMDGGLAPGAMVMGWRGEESGIKAANMEHEVVMSPNSYMYLDYYQGKSSSEPFNIGGNLPLEKVYNYEPLSPKITADKQKYIIGVQGNLWMEFIHSEPKLDYMAFPRLLAVAEIGWSSPRKDYADFIARVGGNLPHLDKEGVNFRIPEPLGLNDMESNSTQCTVTLTPPIKDSKVYYTTNGDDPILKGMLYTSAFQLTLTADKPVEVKCIVRTKEGRVSNTYTASYSLKK